MITGLDIEHQSLWGASHAHQMEALQTDEQITPITTIKRHRAAAGRVRHRPRSFEDHGGRSPLITWDLDLYPQPPTNTHSPTLNSEEPLIQTNKSSQIGRNESSVGHVEVFRVDSVITPIIGKPQPLPAHQHILPRITPPLHPLLGRARKLFDS